MKTKISEAIEVLQKELKKDQSEGSYYHSWKANIAMAFKDEFDLSVYNIDSRVRGDIQEELDIHKIANDSADRFLQQLIQ